MADQGRRGLMDRTQIAVVAQGNRRRVYLPHVEQPPLPRVRWSPQISLPKRTLGFRVQRYGMVEWDALFTDRQLVALSTFSGLLEELRPIVWDHARMAGLADDGIRLRDRGSGAQAYTDAIITYLSFAIDRATDRWSSLAGWQNMRENIRNTFARQALSMVWDFAEANPFSESSGNWSGNVAWISKVVAAVPAGGSAEVLQGHAATRIGEVTSPVVCTDPPYYDNVPYADLSDFFYVWLRRNVADVWPEETATMLTPKAEELIANPDRAGSKEASKRHFEEGMAAVLGQIAMAQDREFPATIFYAFKQQETKRGSSASTGWETFLQGMVDSGLQVTATWPIRTERQVRLRAIKSAALASSVVIACRPRRKNSPPATRRELLTALADELPAAVRRLQEQAIAPVDMAQSAIGPGMEIFSRYANVLEADGTPMPVRAALGLINEALEEALSAEETEFDAPTRWALTWYEQYRHDSGLFGDAETLFKAKVTSVDAVTGAGIAESRAGKVRLITTDELPDEWAPAKDKRLTVWKMAQYLIARLDYSETDAADVLRKVGNDMGGRARRLAYLLYQIADRKGWSEDAVAYNGLIQSWQYVARLAARPRAVEQTLEGL